MLKGRAYEVRLVLKMQCEPLRNVDGAKVYSFRATSPSQHHQAYFRDMNGLGYSPPQQLSLHHMAAHNMEEGVVGGQAVEEGVDASLAQQRGHLCVEVPAVGIVAGAS